MRRAASLLAAILIALAGAIGILLLLQSQDEGALERPPSVQTATTP